MKILTVKQCNEHGTSRLCGCMHAMVGASVFQYKHIGGSYSIKIYVKTCLHLSVVCEHVQHDCVEHCCFI